MRQVRLADREEVLRRHNWKGHMYSGPTRAACCGRCRCERRWPFCGSTPTCTSWHPSRPCPTTTLVSTMAMQLGQASSKRPFGVNGVDVGVGRVDPDPAIVGRGACVCGGSDSGDGFGERGKWVKGQSCRVANGKRRSIANVADGSLCFQGAECAMILKDSRGSLLETHRSSSMASLRRAFYWCRLPGH